MIGWLAARLVARGMFGGDLDRARRFASIGLAVALVLAIAGGGCLWLRAHDAAVLKNDALERKAAQAERDLRGERAANEAAGSAASDFSASQAKLKEAQDEAVRKDPEGAARPVGPSMQSYFDGLRKQTGPGAAERRSPDVPGGTAGSRAGTGRPDKR